VLPIFIVRIVMECIRQEIANLLAAGLIQPSDSPFGSPVLFVVDKKKPTGLRMVIDYRSVTSKTIRNQIWCQVKRDVLWLPPNTAPAGCVLQE